MLCACPAMGTGHTQQSSFQGNQRQYQGNRGLSTFRLIREKPRLSFCSPLTFPSLPASPAGSYSNAEGSYNCTQCAAGTASSAPALAVPCTSCPANTYTTVKGSTVCQ